MVHVCPIVCTTRTAWPYSMNASMSGRYGEMSDKQIRRLNDKKETSAQRVERQNGIVGAGPAQLANGQQLETVVRDGDL